VEVPEIQKGLPRSRVLNERGMENWRILANKSIAVYKNNISETVRDSTGGDYRADGGGTRPQNNLLGGRKRKRPPSIATFSKTFPFGLVY